MILHSNMVSFLDIGNAGEPILRKDIKKDLKRCVYCFQIGLKLSLHVGLQFERGSLPYNVG